SDVRGVLAVGGLAGAAAAQLDRRVLGPRRLRHAVLRPRRPRGTDDAGTVRRGVPGVYGAHEADRARHLLNESVMPRASGASSIRRRGRWLLDHPLARMMTPNVGRRRCASLHIERLGPLRPAGGVEGDLLDARLGLLQQLLAAALERLAALVDRDRLLERH